MNISPINNNFRYRQSATSKVKNYPNFEGKMHPKAKNALFTVFGTKNVDKVTEVIDELNKNPVLKVLRTNTDKDIIINLRTIQGQRKKLRVTAIPEDPTMQNIMGTATCSFEDLEDCLVNTVENKIVIAAYHAAKSFIE